MKFHFSKLLLALSIFLTILLLTAVFWTFRKVPTSGNQISAVVASTPVVYYGTKADCGTNIVPTGTILYPTSVDPNTLKLQTNPDFVKTMASTRGGVDVSNPTPIYDLSVTASAVFSSCYTQKEIAKFPQTPPVTLPFDVSITINTNTVIVGPAKFTYKGVLDTSNRPIYEWKISGWPNGIAASADVELLVDAISSNKPVAILVSKTADLPSNSVATQTSFGLCAPTWGNGKNKVTYMRGGGESILSIFIPKTEKIIQNGFRAIQPFNKYQSEFSQYIDLRDYKGKTYVWASQFFKSANTTYAERNILNKAASESTCVGGIKFMIDTGAIPYRVVGVTSLFTQGIFIGNTNSEFEPGLLETAAIHEYGHAFAGLDDEVSRRNAPNRYNVFGKNCSTQPSFEWSFQGEKYAIPFQGCGGFNNIFSLIPAADVIPIYRPSDDSIMNYKQSKMFNIISCGHIISQIKGGQGSSHFDECVDIANKGGLVIDGLTALPKVPSIFSKLTHFFSSELLFAQTYPYSQGVQNNGQAESEFIFVENFDPSDRWGRVIQFLNLSSISPQPPALSNPLTLTGTGFDPTGNIIHLKSVSTGLDTTISANSADGTTLSFLIPITLALGAYKVSVTTADGTVSNSLDLTVKAPLITLTSPNTGGSWGIGVWFSSSGTVTTGKAGTVKFYLSPTNGTNWQTQNPILLKNTSIAALATPSNWYFSSGLIPVPLNWLAGQYYVVLDWKSTDGTEQFTDFSDVPITISGFTPNIKVITPNGGDIWYLGATKTIQYQTTNLTGQGLAGSLDSYDPVTGQLASTKWISLSPPTGSLSYIVPVTALSGGTYKIRISNGSIIRFNDLVTDSSDAYFTLAYPPQPFRDDEIILNMPKTIQRYYASSANFKPAIHTNFDLDNNNTVDSNDYSKMQKILTQPDTIFDTIYKKTMAAFDERVNFTFGMANYIDEFDVNRDGKINLIDKAIVSKAIIGTRVYTPPTPSPTPTPTPTYSISISKTGTGTGTVSSPSSLSCGTTCSYSFTSGTTVTLTATPDSSSTFAGWTGACTGSSSTCTLTVSNNLSVGATFNPVSVSYTISVSKTGSGTITSSPAGISCGTTCSAPYTYGTNVSLSAVPASGYTFTSWSNCPAPSGSTCNVNINNNFSITATFTALPVTYTLTVTKLLTNGASGTITSSPAGISCGATCSASFTANNTITLTATPDAGSTFTGWSNCSVYSGNTCYASLTGNTTVGTGFVK